MDAIRVGLELVGIVTAGLAAYYGVRTGVAVLEAKFAALETRMAENFAAVHTRINDLVHRG